MIGYYYMETGYVFHKSEYGTRCAGQTATEINILLLERIISNDESYECEHRKIPCHAHIGVELVRHMMRFIYALTVTQLEYVRDFELHPPGGLGTAILHQERTQG